MEKESSNMIIDFFSAYVNDILSSRKKGSINHKAKNIKASGDEVENTVRSIVKKLIPVSYYTTQGHIIDLNQNISNQFDIIIADNNGSPVLFTSGNTDYLTYESIYAIGEVKTSFQDQYIMDFVQKISKLNTDFTREKASIFQVTQNIKHGGNNFGDQRTEEGWSYKNPLFKFMFIVESRNIDVKKTLDYLEQVNPMNTPNIIVILDKGVFLNSKMTLAQKDSLKINTVTSSTIDVNIKLDLEFVRLYPEFTSKDENDLFKWSFIEFKENPASNLAYLIYSLNYHLSRCIVLKPDLVNYHSQLFQSIRYMCSKVSQADLIKLARSIKDFK